jgi:tetratricopeptide (TPR) repeat protein
MSCAGGIVLLLWIPYSLTLFQTPPPLSPNARTDVKELVESLLKAHEQQLAGFRQREQAYQDQVKALTNTVTALAQQRSQPNAPPGIEEALSQLRQGHTAAAETIFETILARKAAEGQAANQQAAEAARHLGALAFLHNTDKALTAYRRAVTLDPANAKGWNQLGLLLHRIGHLDEAVGAYNQVHALGTKRGDQNMLAIAYGNLGNVYEVRGDLTQAEAMYRNALEINETLGYKDGMARDYGNLGVVYRMRGDLTQAEAMHRKALVLNEALSRKEGMATAYSNLGVVYEIRGDLDQTETMHRKALELDKVIDNKEGMARDYGNLGDVYRIRGDLDQAEAMHRKALELNRATGRKEGMANQYGNLGSIYRIRGDLDQAEVVYRRALTLFQEMGAAPQVEQVQELLRALRAQGSP